jgi:hypothetical protein
MARARRSSVHAALGSEPWWLSTQRVNALILLALSLAVFAALALGAAFGPEALPDRNASPFRLLTGLPDPMCGLTHSVLAIGHRDWWAAAEYNTLGFVAVALAFVLLPQATLALARDRPLSWPPRALPLLVAVVLASWIVQLAQSLG